LNHLISGCKQNGVLVFLKNPTPKSDQGNKEAFQGTPQNEDQKTDRHSHSNPKSVPKSQRNMPEVNFKIRQNMYRKAFIDNSKSDPKTQRNFSE